MRSTSKSWFLFALALSEKKMERDRKPLSLRERWKYIKLSCVSKWCIELHPSSLTLADFYLLILAWTLSSSIHHTQKLKINPSSMDLIATGSLSVQLQQRLGQIEHTHAWHLNGNVIMTPVQSCMLQFEWFPQWKALEVDTNWNALLFNKLPCSIH